MANGMRKPDRPSKPKIPYPQQPTTNVAAEKMSLKTAQTELSALDKKIEETKAGIEEMLSSMRESMEQELASEARIARRLLLAPVEKARLAVQRRIDDLKAVVSDREIVR